MYIGSVSCLLVLWMVGRSVSWLVVPSVGQWVCHYLLKGWEVPLPCSLRKLVYSSAKYDALLFLRCYKLMYMLFIQINVVTFSLCVFAPKNLCHS